ncbi:MAG: hypothetical protein IPO05_17185 [Flavobacteriales bacterium]|nr:hypothetical protein [Flavobacteriales bacterium]
MILRLLSDEAALASWVPFKVVAREGKIDAAAKLGVKVLTLQVGAGNSIKEATHEIEDDVISIFTNTVRRIIDSGVAEMAYS